MDKLSKRLAKAGSSNEKRKIGGSAITNDKRLSKLHELIDVIVLDDFVEA